MGSESHEIIHLYVYCLLSIVKKKVSNFIDMDIIYIFYFFTHDFEKIFFYISVDCKSIWKHCNYHKIQYNTELMKLKKDMPNYWSF
jgi:hypothetical protein